MPRFVVESWAVEYGTPFEAGDPPDGPEPNVDLGVELEPGDWRAITPAGPPAASIVLVDGVRRIDARVWVPAGDSMKMGICASYAAGVVHCDNAATVTTIEVARGAFAPVELGDVATSIATYKLHPCVSDRQEDLSQQLQRAMGGLETQVAMRAEEADLVVLDGPLSGRESVPGAMGYIKSHRVEYLPGPGAAVVAALAPGERSPVFFVESTWSRYSWYIRLPGGAGHPWAGIARCEAAKQLSPEQAIALADRAAATLPRYASQPHREPRAPQNLYPVAGLEQQLRHRLGDGALLERALRAAAV
jgi:hypothetical protein